MSLSDPDRAELEKEESELKKSFESLNDMRHNLVPINDAEIRKLSRDHNTLLSLGEVQESYAKLTQIEAVKKSSAFIIHQIELVKQRLIEIEKQKAEMAKGKKVEPEKNEKG